jgi:hypothetical protein
LIAIIANCQSCDSPFFFFFSKLLLSDIIFHYFSLWINFQSETARTEKKNLTCFSCKSSFFFCTFNVEFFRRSFSIKVSLKYLIVICQSEIHIHIYIHMNDWLVLVYTLSLPDIWSTVKCLLNVAWMFIFQHEIHHFITYLLLYPAT